jgi:type II secretory pathway pseudopilin PulG
MRSAARSILTSGYAVDREDGAAAVELISVLVAVVVVAASWHAARGNEQQAEAARTTAQQLRQLYRTTARRPLEVLSARGRAVSSPQRERYAQAVRTVVPEAAGESAAQEWDALSATLAEAEAAGHDPVALLERARSRRELETADSVTAVMVWRVRRLANLPPVDGTKARKAVRPAPLAAAPGPGRSGPGRRRSR